MKGRTYYGTKESNWKQMLGGCKPPQSRVELIPKNMNKPFIKRFLEWWK